MTELAVAYQDCWNVGNIKSWLDRFDQLTDALDWGDSTYRQVEDHIFELKVINHLFKAFPGCKIIYEPKGTNKNGKDCDLEIMYKGQRYLVEIKSFHPEWKKAKTEIPTEYIAENNTVIMDGASYHTFQATRGHVIDVTHHTEQKLENYEGAYISVLAVPDGFHLNIEDLRDFVFIYRNGYPRVDDPLGPMTIHNIKDPFKGTINQFWAFPFPQESFALDNGKEVTVVAPLIHNDEKLEL